MKTRNTPATPGVRAPKSGIHADGQPPLAELYRRAQAQLRKQRKDGQAPGGSIKSEAGPQRLLQELQIHQVELEMQNVELHEARDRMEALLEKYTDLYDFAPVGHFSLEESGRVMEANLTAAAMLGVERSRLITQPLSRFVATTSQLDFAGFLKRVFAGTEKQNCEAAMLKPGTAVFWANFQGAAAISVSSPKRWCRVAFSDITSLKQAEERLRQNDALFFDLVEQAPVGMYVVDDKLRLLQVNPKARPPFSNIPRLIGQDLSAIMHVLWPARIADEITEHFRRVLQTGKTYVSPDFSERRRDLGVREFYEWQVQRITLPTGQHGVVCFFTNITGRKKAEAAQRRVEVLAASNRKLEKEINRRKKVEDTLKQTQKHQRAMLEESARLQDQLRQLSRQILSAQEDERKNISRELHDVIAQTLTGINVRLAALAKEAATNTKGLDRNIARTQRMVEQSVDIVHRFARELRPAVLDDLGLIPALHSFLKIFSKRTRIRVHLKAFAAVEQLDAGRRTVLFRVAQEALTNVARHAHASRVEVSIQKSKDGIRMTILDDGKSFQADRVLLGKGSKRLGLLGMRERLEMVGGHFSVESTPGSGTTIIAQIPNAKTGMSDRAR
jgi:PAS domain S-box-containing protein